VWEEILKLKIGVLLGGSSQEREISLRSGEAVFKALQSLKLNVVKIDPAHDLEKQLADQPIDLAFLVLHGTGGEDGTIQCRLDALGIPYTGSGSSASACAFDKFLTKMKLVANGIPTPTFALIDSQDALEVLERFRFPIFIKPLQEGSSIGVELIENLAEFKKKIPQAFQRYGKLLVEERIVGRELTVGILRHEALPVIELKPRRAFYDYEAKYTKGMTEYLVPAPLDPALSKKIQVLSLEVHDKLQLLDFSRVDLMLDQKNNPFVLEVNTIPGFTETSLLPKAAECVGIDFAGLCQAILESAWTRYSTLRRQHPIKLEVDNYGQKKQETTVV
jgi:D-alanine-D-alanine ligase